MEGLPCQSLGSEDKAVSALNIYSGLGIKLEEAVF